MMLVKGAGAVLLVAGVALSFPLLGGLVVGVWGAVVLVCKLGLVAAVLFGGRYLVNRRPMLHKVAGAFLLVSGTVLAMWLLGGLVFGVFGMIVFLAKTGLVLGLIYWGWCWLNDGSINFPGRRR